MYAKTPFVVYLLVNHAERFTGRHMTSNGVQRAMPLTRARESAADEHIVLLLHFIVANAKLKICHNLELLTT